MARNKIGNIRILNRLYDPANDLYAVFGRAANDDKGKKVSFIAGWQHRDTSKLEEVAHFSTESEAQEAFRLAAYKLGEPVVPDKQQEAVYAWERKYIDPYDETMIARKEAKALNKQVSADYGMEEPRLTFVKNTSTSEYDCEEHKIYLAESYRITVLHELAHAIVNKQCEEMGRDHVAHAPAFVHTAIALYHRYAGFNMAYLISSAGKADILGDLKTPVAEDTSPIFAMPCAQ